MGEVLRFPQERRRTASGPAVHGPGQVLILPVIRIEHHDLPPPPLITADPPARGGKGPKRGRRSA